MLFVTYILALAGFDMHVCGDNGQVYVESLLCDVSCQALHPEAPCHCHECCCSHCSVPDCGSGCVDEDDCCTDFLDVLTVCTDKQQVLSIPVCHVSVFFGGDVEEPAFLSVSVSCQENGCGQTEEPDIHKFCVLRA